MFFAQHAMLFFKLGPPPYQFGEFTTVWGLGRIRRHVALPAGRFTNFHLLQFREPLIKRLPNRFALNNLYTGLIGSHIKVSGLTTLRQIANASPDIRCTRASHCGLLEQLFHLTDPISNMRYKV